MSHEMLNLPTFLPNEKLVFSAILIVKAFIALEVVHRIFRHLVFGQEAKRLAKAASAYKKHQIEHNDGSASKESQHQETVRDEFALKPVPRDALAKTAAQFGHVVANSTLAFCGVYYWYCNELPEISEATIDDRVAGYFEHSIFGCGLIAYNFWSTFISYTVWGEEELIMTMHHLCASTVGFVSAFTTHGSRYYSPFFYGVSELSSIPLSLVNIYKFRPDWHVNMPILQHLLKCLFALTFLTIRVGCWMPVIKSFFSDVYHLQTTSDPAMTLGFRLTLLITSAIPALLLTCLQLFWAYRIVQIVWRILLKQLTQKVKRI